jgi:oxygen-independent coproporphyrinogen-3 oxidase
MNHSSVFGAQSGVTPVAFDSALIAKHQRSGPRYTSYPTADRFAENVGADALRARLAKRERNPGAGPWSIYVHLPFCATVCYYCGCNRIVTANISRATAYVDYVVREIALYGDQLGEERTVRQMHWGGGTPTFLPFEDMTRLISALRAEFDFLPNAELAIELDPRRIDAAGVARLAHLGFNRMSLGVQDFDADVQAAVNRIQSEEQTLAVIQAARATGFRSVNVDLIYGLPRQTPDGFERTLDKVIRANPDRIALYSYAHLPGLFKAQRQIDEGELPSPGAKLEILGMAISRFTEAGYVYIGMDHFARPDDDLAIAQREGRLQRNFQGYSSYAGCDLLAFGVSGIGALDSLYYQNHRDLATYYHAIDRRELAIARGIELGLDDKLRRGLIQALMCRFEIIRHTVEAEYAIDFDRYFESELTELRSLAEDELVTLDAEGIHVTPRGRFLVRNVAMVFDRYLRDAQQRTRYSKVI